MSRPFNNWLSRDTSNSDLMRFRWEEGNLLRLFVFDSVYILTRKIFQKIRCLSIVHAIDESEYMLLDFMATSSLTFQKKIQIMEMFQPSESTSSTLVSSMSNRCMLRRFESSSSFQQIMNFVSVVHRIPRSCSHLHERFIQGSFSWGSIFLHLFT